MIVDPFVSSSTQPNTTIKMIAAKIKITIKGATTIKMIAAQIKITIKGANTFDHVYDPPRKSLRRKLIGRLKFA